MTLRNLSGVRKCAADKGRGMLWMHSAFALFVVLTSHAYAQANSRKSIRPVAGIGGLRNCQADWLSP